MTMEEFLLQLLDKDFNWKKGKYQLSNSFLKLDAERSTQAYSRLKQFKGSIHYIKALMEFMKQYELAAVTSDSVEYEDQVLYSKEEILYFMNFFSELPLQEKMDLLNKRLAIKLLL
jgi:DNA helicase-2/ATP-dependent DNA helicase PcrA